MSRVAHWIALATPIPPLESVCNVHPFKGWHWKTILEKDPEWVLWLITESSTLLDLELEKALLKGIRDRQWEGE